MHFTYKILLTENKTMPKQIKIDITDNEEGLAISPLSPEGYVAVANYAASVSNNPHAAEQIRDLNGKLIQVRVNLPDDVSQGNLETAAAAINANRGVAFVSLVTRAEQFMAVCPDGGVASQADGMVWDLQLDQATHTPAGFYLAIDGNNTAPSFDPRTGYPNSLAISSLVKIPILSSDNSAQVATKIVAGMWTDGDLNGGTIGDFVTDNLDGTLSFNYSANNGFTGDLVDARTFNADDSSPGSLLVIITTQGV